MDAFKRPEMIISILTALGLAGSSTYFHGKIKGLEQDVTKITGKWEVLSSKINGLNPKLLAEQYQQIIQRLIAQEEVIQRQQAVILELAQEINPDLVRKLKGGSSSRNNRKNRTKTKRHRSNQKRGAKKRSAGSSNRKRRTPSRHRADDPLNDLMEDLSQGSHGSRIDPSSDSESFGEGSLDSEQSWSEELGSSDDSEPELVQYRNERSSLGLA